MPLDQYKRYQNNFSFNEIYPQKNDGYCDCGCGKKLEGKKRRWATDKCISPLLNEYYILKGNTSIIREELFKRDSIDDKIYCASCNTNIDDNNWDADHILEVRHGGGGCNLDNYQILCKTCHKKKTKKNYKKT
jgi:5-methylcytosine-specific restriction endonuclease McrA